MCLNVEPRSCEGAEGVLLVGVVVIVAVTLRADGVFFVIALVESFMSDMFVAVSRMIELGVTSLSTIASFSEGHWSLVSLLSAGS